MIRLIIKMTIDKRRETDKGWPIKFCIGYQGVFFYISTGYYAQYELENGEINKLEKDCTVKNIALTKMRSILMEESLKLDDGYSPNILREHLKFCLFGTEKEKRTFLNCATEFMAHITNEGTLRTYQTMYNKVKEYDARATLDSMNVSWLQDFETYMKKKGYRANYYGQIERSIRAVFNFCIDREYTTNYPFRRFRTKSEKTIKRNLTLEQLLLLRDYPCEEYQVIYRDMFMLMVYMIGINAVDLFTMPKMPDLKVGSYINYKRTKLGSKESGIVKVKVEPEALEIINRYAGEEYMLCIVEKYCKNYKDFLHHMNKALQSIGPFKRVGRGGKKEKEPLFPGLSSYWARHTWATLAAKCKVPMDVIGKALGHADSRMADIYIEWDHTLIDKANRKVLNALKK